MKCIKEQCPYYNEHDYYASFFICTLPITRPSFKKDKEFECIIDDEIIRLAKKIQFLNEFKGEQFGSRMATKEELDKLKQ